MASYFHLKSNALSGTWTANAVANETVGAGVDAEIFLPKYDPDVYAMLGFVGVGTEPTSYTQLLFAAYIGHPNTSVYVYESGGYKGAWTGLDWGSRASVHRDGTTGAITYREDGNVVYTSASTNTGALEIACSIYQPDATATELEAIIGGVTYELSWGYNANVEITEDTSHAAGSPVYNNIGGTTTGAYACAARATEDIPADTDGIFSCVHDNTYSRQLFGLVDVDEAVTNYTDLNYCLFIYPAGNQAYVYESGTLKHTATGLTEGDEYSVRRDGTTGAITYYRNETLLYTSAATSTAAHSLATSIYNKSHAIWRPALSVGGGAKTPVTWEYFHNSQEWEDYTEAYLNSLPTPDIVLTQAPMEFAEAVVDPETRLTQIPMEFAEGVVDPETRLTQLAVEFLYLPATPTTRVTQAPVEVLLADTDALAKITQAPVEVLLADVTVLAKATQVPVEVLYTYEEPVVSALTQQVAEVSFTSDAVSIEAASTQSITEVLLRINQRRATQQVAEVSLVSDEASVEALSTQSLAEVLVSITIPAYHVSQQVSEITYSNNTGSIEVFSTQSLSEALIQLALAPPSYITHQVAEISYSNTTTTKVFNSQSVLEVLVNLYAGPATRNAVQYIAIMS